MIYLAFFLAILVAVVQISASMRETQATRDFPPEGRLLDVGGRQVHAVVMGTGPDLVLIHGASGNTRDMTFSLAPRLAERYRVIVIDRPGLGYTDRLNATGATLTQQAALLRDTARQLGAERPIVMGQSYGGAVALAWAAHYPEDLAALVLASAPSNTWDTGLGTFYDVTSSRWGQALIVPLITAFVPKSVVENAVEAVFAPQKAPKGYAEYLGAPLTLRRVSLRANADQRANLLSEIKDLIPLYGDITVPTEIVHGIADTTVGLQIHSEKLVHQIEGAVLTRLPGIGHMTHQVAQQAVIDAIDRAATRAVQRGG
ncbi:alpha/beta hydrolase [Pelagivirga sediminicola]|uniref:Alpha/beta hydrolase n=1 Tax=Pelagivirga sediminicola TaxID=2170575 RepID=A0A2T7GB34_9RHOB|nr:alpha/beta hydrolase [Pelagivirga sediminicola]PVA11640.1 alpha/beta hydrolase [Pelagivirga sediminicola]